jgi:hypothetical protein
MDVDGDSELGFKEFLMFLVTIKKLDVKCKEDPEYKNKAFPPDLVCDDVDTHVHNFI